MGFEDAVAEAIHRPPREPLLGTLKSDHIQLCPQNRGVLTPELAQDLRHQFPRTRFRLHANVRVLTERYLYDWCDWNSADRYWSALASTNRALDAHGYVAHAGRRDRCSLAALFDNARRASDVFGCPAGIEGHYPTRDNVFLISDWDEYHALFESGVPYALDLSHLNILVFRSRRCERTLIQEMLACERCIEVHLSANDGLRDQHRVLEQEPWWWPLLEHVRDGAVIFSEGNQRVRR
ncbi:hypothetical protein NE850_38090 [Paraburkholderia sp. USG1]|uniref:hypothetical protein n=1 Tax=Paraburkholderia sp. USG1 TaxID=2952268 RepID=UPI00285D6D77|nr:hypothetical protein [Paraburkholderia sp. USG1]MDR8402138.1 hypothetical protein [Paraburkholderia sp. USG1]